MEPFRASVYTCANCGALKPDTYAPNGALVCRGCAGTMEANARLEVGNNTTRVGAILGIAVGVVMLLGGILVLFSGGMSKASARLVGLMLGLGIAAIVVSVRNLKSLKGR